MFTYPCHTGLAGSSMALIERGKSSTKNADASAGSRGSLPVGFDIPLQLYRKGLEIV